MRLVTTNHGPLILASNYWGSDLDRAGTLHLSCNAGAFRLLLPSGWEGEVEGMRTGKEAIVSRGRLQDGPCEAIEILLDDGSANPYAVHLGVDQVDRLPTDANSAGEWIFTAWTAPRRGKPHKALERPAYYRRVPRVPWLKPWKR